MPRERSPKSALLPSVRVSAELREQIESVLGPDETVSSFVESSVRTELHTRNMRQAFLQRGLSARDDSRRANAYYGAGHVLEDLQSILDEKDMAPQGVR